MVPFSFFSSVSADGLQVTEKISTKSCIFIVFSTFPTLPYEIKSLQQRFLLWVTPHKIWKIQKPFTCLSSTCWVRKEQNKSLKARNIIFFPFFSLFLWDREQTWKKNKNWEISTKNSNFPFFIFGCYAHILQNMSKKPVSIQEVDFPNYLDHASGRVTQQLKV